MHVYGSTASPFVQRTLMTARAKGHELEVRPPLGGSMQSPEFQAISPMGRIPLLETDDGDRICESSAIAAYLDDALGAPSLLPDDPVERARVHEIVSIVVGEVAAGMRPVLVARVFRRPVPDELAEAGWTQAEAGLAALDRLLTNSNRFCVGDRLSAADCAFVPILTLMAIIDPITGARRLIDAQPNVARVYAALSGNAVAARTIDEMRSGFADILSRQQAAVPSPTA